MAAQTSGGQLLAGIVLGFLVAAALALGVSMSGGDAGKPSRPSAPPPAGAGLPEVVTPKTLDRPPRDPSKIAPSQLRSIGELRRRPAPDAGSR